MRSSTPSLRRLLGGMSLAALALVLGACGGDSGGPGGPSGPGPDTNDPDPIPAPPSIQGRALFGLTCANQLVLFGSGNPSSLARAVPINGMPAGAVMLGIDFGPSGLYGVGSDSRVYSVDTVSGAASAVGAPFAPAASGEHFGLTYDASAGKLYLSGVESNWNQGLDPASGAGSGAAVELAYAAGDAHADVDAALAAEAHYGSALYGVETNANAVVTVDPATGQMATVGDLPFNIYVCSGMDVASDGTALAALSTDDGSELYQIDLGTGAASYLGAIAGSPVHSMAIRP